MGLVIDYAAERLAREEEARAAQARKYLADVAAHGAAVLWGTTNINPELGRQLFMDLMPADLPLELTEAHILKLERNRT